MSNFNKLIDRFDRFFLYYLEKITSRLAKPVRKLYMDIIYGILKGQSVILSGLALCLDAAVTLLAVLIERGPALWAEPIAMSKHLKRQGACIKFYQLLSGISTLLGHKEKGIRNKERIEHRGQPRKLTLF